MNNGYRDIPESPSQVQHRSWITALQDRHSGACSRSSFRRMPSSGTWMCRLRTKGWKSSQTTLFYKELSNRLDTGLRRYDGSAASPLVSVISVSSVSSLPSLVSVSSVAKESSVEKKYVW